jgi:predicted rRNA methylase YqxC with S4 and FtsJ domains
MQKNQYVENLSTVCEPQHDAARVYAMDVWHNQLHEKLRLDARVISLDGVNPVNNFCFQE